MAITDIPLTAFRFEVVLDLDEPTPGLSSPLCDAAFAEVDGLDMTMQHKTVESGGVNDRQLNLIGPITHGQVTLKRGMTDNLQLWSWCAQGARPGSVLTAHGEITMWAADGTPSVQFTLSRCLPVRLRAPGLNARDGLVAVEELTLVYEQLVVAAPGAAGGISIGASVDLSAGASVSASASLSASAGFSAGASVGGGFG
jgi:phage tail-like protein